MKYKVTFLPQSVIITAKSEDEARDFAPKCLCISDFEIDKVEKITKRKKNVN